MKPFLSVTSQPRQVASLRTLRRRRNSRPARTSFRSPATPSLRCWGRALTSPYLENFNGTLESNLLKDARGSVVGLTNPTKRLTDTYSYEPYGAPTHTYGSTLDPGQFGGIPYDVNSDMYYMRHRWYLPAIGRFISRDPIGIAGGINVYAYANDDPVDLSDPTGLCSSSLYDGAAEAGEASEAAMAGSVGGGTPAMVGDLQAGGTAAGYGGAGFGPGVGIVTGIVGGLSPGLLQNRLLPDHGGAGLGGAIPEAYYGQNGGGLTPVQLHIGIPGFAEQWANDNPWIICMATYGLAGLGVGGFTGAVAGGVGERLGIIGSESLGFAAVAGGLAFGGLSVGAYLGYKKCGPIWGKAQME